MPLFIERIEIRQQPEHRRYWAEVEVRIEAGLRRTQIAVPYAEGRDGMLAALSAYMDELDPPDDGLAALRAEAGAAGIDVDGRWGEARLRREIEAARGADA